jgi:hypothetical protein
MRLCFGSFATVLTLCAAGGTTNQELCGTILLSVADEGYDLRKDRDVTSKLIRGERNLSPSYVTVHAKTAKPETVAAYFKKAVLPLLDQGKLRFAVGALQDIVANDDRITPDTVIDFVGGTTKKTFIDDSGFCAFELLAGIFLYIAVNCKIPQNEIAATVSEIKTITVEYIEGFASRVNAIAILAASRNLSAEMSDELGIDLASFPKRTEDLLLLQEVECHCPLCRNNLIKKKNGVTLRNYKIAPISGSMASPRQMSLNSHIALCRSCADEYVSSNSVSEHAKLQVIKRTLSDRRVALESTAGIQIDEQIADILHTIARVPKEELTLRMEPVEVEKKIKASEIPLLIKISGYVERYFYRVRDALKTLDRNGRLRSKEIAEDVNACYKKLRRGKHSQEQVYDDLVAWLETKAKPGCHLACEIMIAFFVQDCEVFDVLAE